MPGFMPGIHVFAAQKKVVDGTKLGLARVSQLINAGSRASPTSGDKPGHDGEA